MRRERLLRTLCWASIGPLAVMGLVRLSLEGPRSPTLWVAVAMLAAIATAPFVHRWTGSVHRAAVLPAIAVACGVPGILWFTGGMTAPALPYVPVIPMLFAPFVGRRGAIALAAALVVDMVLVAAFASSAVPQAAGAHLASVPMRAVYVSFAVALAGFAAFMQDHERERAGRGLEDGARSLYEVSIRDGLTRLFNRGHFLDRLGGEIAFAKRHGTRVGALLIDVDHFKRVNDTFGHAAGDAVLIEVGKRLARELREEDIVARYGGEEFAVALRELSLDQTRVVAERLRQAMAQAPIDVHGRGIAVTVSIGCAVLEAPTQTREELLAIADARMYAAKRGGRNRVESGKIGPERERPSHAAE